jgi:putative transposase
MEKALSPGAKRRLIAYMNAEHGVSICQGGQAVGLAQSIYWYNPKPNQDEAVIDALNALVARRSAIGFWQAYHRLR